MRHLSMIYAAGDAGDRGLGVRDGLTGRVRWVEVCSMITLTAKAATKITELQADAEEGQLLRVFVESGGCSGFQYGMSFDKEKDDDSRIESEGVTVLMDEASLAYMDGSTIDFDDGLQGKGFDIQNPNAESTCGCGKSFS